MELRVAKELLHIQRWLSVAATIVVKGKGAYDSDEVAQEAPDGTRNVRLMQTSTVDFAYDICD